MEQPAQDVTNLMNAVAAVVIGHAALLDADQQRAHEFIEGITRKALESVELETAV